MAIENYTILNGVSIDDLPNFLIQFTKNSGWGSKLSSPKFDFVRKAIDNNIPDKLRSQDFTYNYSTKIYWIIHGLTDFPIYHCPMCPVTKVLVELLNG